MIRKFGLHISDIENLNTIIGTLDYQEKSLQECIVKLPELKNKNGLLIIPLEAQTFIKHIVFDRIDIITDPFFPFDKIGICVEENNDFDSDDTLIKNYKVLGGFKLCNF